MAYSSDNGVTWTSITNHPFNGASDAIFDIAFGNNMFVAVGWDSNGSKIAYSRDGRSWTAVQGRENNWPGKIIFGNGKFVASGENIDYSFDGISWTHLEKPPFGANNITPIAYGNGRFVAAVGGDLLTGTRMAYSDDGINWTLNSTFQPTPIMRRINAIAYSSTINRFALSGVAGSDIRKRLYSDDGVNWIDNGLFSGSAGGASGYAMAWGNNMFVAGGSIRMSYSTDGINWTFINAPLRREGSTAERGIYDIAYGNGRFVAVGSNGTIAYCDW
jgi:hypothetical protein